MSERIGKLRWEIQKPYPQLMVGDGERFWIYDQELAQVTVKKMGQAIGSTPQWARCCSARASLRSEREVLRFMG